MKVGVVGHANVGLTTKTLSKLDTPIAVVDIENTIISPKDLADYIDLIPQVLVEPDDKYKSRKVRKNWQKKYFWEK